MLTQEQRAEVAVALYRADPERRIILQQSRTWPGMDLHDAYAIQAIWAEKPIADGARVTGQKIGLTSRAMQKASRISEPDYGVMLDDALFRDGAVLRADRFIKPRLEVELGQIDVAFQPGQ